MDSLLNEALKEDLEYTYGKLSLEEIEKLKGSRILLTGCAGFLGFYWVHFLYYFREKLAIKKVICLDNFMLGYPKWLEAIGQEEHFIVKKFDIIKDRLEDIEAAEQVDYVIHMASIASPLFYRQYPIETLDANIWGLRRLLDFYVKRPLKGLLFYSSSEIYGDPVPEAIPTPESYFGNVCATGPRSCYDESKRFGETMCMLFAQKYAMPIGVARPFNNYGPGMKINDKRVPADFANDILHGRDLEILSNGSPTRTFCYVADAVAGYLKILAYGRYDYFNIGIEAPEISIGELAEIYRSAGQDVFNYQGKIKYACSEDKQYLTNDPQRRCPDIAKARTILNYDPTIKVEEGVKRFLRFIHQSDEENLQW